MTGTRTKFIISHRTPKRRDCFPVGRTLPPRHYSSLTPRGRGGSGTPGSTTDRSLSEGRVVQDSRVLTLGEPPPRIGSRGTGSGGGWEGDCVYL